MRHLLLALAALLAFSAFARSPDNASVTPLVTPSSVHAPLIADAPPQPTQPGEHVCSCGGGEKKSTAICKADESCHCEKSKAECRKE